MDFLAARVPLKDILSFRDLFLQAMNCQIRYDACHARGWTDSYLLSIDGAAVGYGSIKGQERAGRDTIFEFYVVPPFSTWSRNLFGRLIAASRASRIECQSNDPFLSPMLYEFAREIASEVVLFADAVSTAHTPAVATISPSISTT